MPVLFLLVLFCASVTAQENRYEGQTLRSVRVEPGGNYLDASDLKDKLAALVPGRPLRMSDVRVTISRLFASGRFDNISVDATAERSGVAIVFDVTPASFIRDVTVLGVPDPPAP